jgi:hypothetical protein
MLVRQLESRLMSRRPFQPTEENRRTVLAMAGYGIPHDHIAVVVGIAPMTLRKHFRAELDTGETLANAKVAETLYRMATSGENVAAAIFWLKARAGWSEKFEHQHGGAIVIHLNRADSAL